MAIVIEVPEYICIDYEKITEKDYSELVGKQQDMYEWFKECGLLGHAMSTDIYKWKAKKKLQYLKKERGLTIVPCSDEGQIQLEGMIE